MLPSLQLHIDDKQNASGSLKVSTDHGNATYSVSVRPWQAAHRDCWWANLCFDMHRPCKLALRHKPTPFLPLLPHHILHRPAPCLTVARAGSMFKRLTSAPLAPPVCLGRSPTRLCATAMS